MSQWTHVNGNIRIDCLGGSHEEIKQNLKEILGAVKNYDHVGMLGENYSECPVSGIPCGSEGSIEYEIYEVPRGFNIGIWGDLRSYGADEIHEIVTWFKKIITQKPKSLYFIRDAVLYIDIEYGENIILLHDYEKENKYKKYILGKDKYEFH